MRRLSLLVIGLAVTALIGWAVPRWLVGDGVEEFRSDPERHSMAAEAHDLTLRLQESPIERLFIPGVRVVRVEREPGHCEAGEPGASEPMADFTATVRLYSWFGIPAGEVRVSCGGWRWERMG